MCCLAHGELAWLFYEPHSRLEDCLNMLLSCFIKRMSVNKCKNALRKVSPCLRLSHKEMSNKAKGRLRDPASQLPLAAEASSRNLVFTF